MNSILKSTMFYFKEISTLMHDYVHVYVLEEI